MIAGARGQTPGASERAPGLFFFTGRGPLAPGRSEDVPS
jgi:hypothetical protein